MPQSTTDRDALHRQRVSERERDIKEHPENHRHDFIGLQSCCLVDGVMVLHLMDLHSEYASFGTNGGVRCDVSSGPCACGAWH